MRNGKYLHYFDTCIFLHWLVDQPKDAAVIDGIEEIILTAEKRKSITIVTSTITRIEVLKSKMGTAAADMFSRMLGQFVVQSANVDPLVADVAHEIRDYYHSLNPPLKLKTPDCIHLATAIVYECDEMNTLDGSGIHQRPHELIALSGKIAGGKYSLEIKKPVRSPGLLQFPPSP